MNARLLVAALTLAGVGATWSPPAQAIGCLSGGAAGALAGHMVNHGVLGAVGGCIAGHQYNKHKKEQAAQQSAAPSYNGSVDSSGRTR